MQQGLLDLTVGIAGRLIEYLFFRGIRIQVFERIERGLRVIDLIVERPLLPVA
jgi:hypothetical protein